MMKEFKPIKCRCGRGHAKPISLAQGGQYLFILLECPHCETIIIETKII